jgi:hypothetical protein
VAISTTEVDLGIVGVSDGCAGGFVSVGSEVDDPMACSSATGTDPTLSAHPVIRRITIPMIRCKCLFMCVSQQKLFMCLTVSS